MKFLYIYQFRLNLKSHIPYNQMMFFDDDKRNIQSVTKLGVRTHHLKDKTGISFKHIHLSSLL